MNLQRSCELPPILAFPVRSPGAIGCLEEYDSSRKIVRVIVAGREVQNLAEVSHTPVILAD